MTVSPFFSPYPGGASLPMPAGELARKVDDLLISEGFIKDFLYVPPNHTMPAGYCVAGAINKILTGSHIYPRAQGEPGLFDSIYMFGALSDFARKFGAVAQQEFPYQWMSAVSRVIPQAQAPVDVSEMIAFNNHPHVGLADMRRVLMLMQ